MLQCYASMRSVWRRQLFEVFLAAKATHLAHDPVATGNDVGRGTIRSQPNGIRQHSRQRCGLGTRKARSWLAKELAPSRLDAEHAAPELRDVEIDLEDAFLRPRQLDEYREIRLDAFADVTAAIPQEQVLGDLLQD